MAQMKKIELGIEEQLVGFTLQGAPSSPMLLHTMIEIIRAVGMTPDGPPDIRHYPNGHGAGGCGCQIYMPLTESWMIGGTWTKLNITRVVLSSCKLYNEEKVRSLLESQIGSILKQLPGGIF